MIETLQRPVVLALLATASVLGSFASAAEHAPAQKGQIYGTVGSYLFGRDDDADLDSYFGAGLGIGGRVTDEWAVEFQYSRGFSESFGLGLNYDVEVEGYRLDALYDFGGTGLFRPYAVGGLGYFNYDPSATFVSEDDSAFLNVGGGVAIPATKRLTTRADARLLYVEQSEELMPALTLSLSYVFAGPTSEWPVVERDSDGDGVLDRDDRCPGTSPGTNVDATGCPLDGDQDGVPDGSDACPRTPAGVSVDSRGCALDSDRDGVPDHLDACPDTPRGDEIDRRGCTVEEEVEEVSQRIELKVEFDFNSDTLRPSSYSEIDRVAEFMDEYPDTVAQIEGHTDSRGADAYNQALSERRAYAVRDYLIDEADVDPRRITAVGYGESRPIADNGTEAGRQLNRRVTALIQTRED
ncbi:MAG: OmpA family protein [Pseudomonadales bacterium]|jgi:OOP family OmpA-OmpF porin|nr:OmpA family protein [Pseudomonadales bacterium]